MTQGRQISRTEYVTPKTEQETLAKALRILTPKQQNQQNLTDQMLNLITQGRTNFTNICQQLGISRPTGYKYWQDWKQTEEASLIDWEWWSLYEEVRKKNPEKALECLTRLKHKMITEKLEVKEEVTSKHVEELNVTMRNYEATVLRVAERYTPKDSIREQVDSSKPPTTTT